jgi:predicted  nucleic acid-binding Zn-ribbon protein
LEQDFIAELEKKVNSLIQGYTDLKKEKEKFSEEISGQNTRIQGLEGENSSLKEGKQELENTAAEQRKKLDTAAQKVKELIAKLEAVE